MAVQVGQQAPDFELVDQDRQPVRLSAYRGRKNVVLIFYPFSFTAVCGGELAAVRDDLLTFENDTVTVLAVSTDSAAVQKAWGLNPVRRYPSGSIGPVTLG